jgi:hypothetical protein
MKRNFFFSNIASVFLSIVILGSISITTFPPRVEAQFAGPAQPVVILETSPADLDVIQNTITAFAAPTTALASTNTALFSGITSITSLEQLAKNTALDPIAWAVSKAVLQSVVNSTVNWINHGFNGAPGFVTNLPGTLQAVGDTAANSFISQLATNGSINSPFQTQVANAVSTNYLQSTGSGGFFAQNAFTLNQASPNPTAFLGGNFSQGGWNAWMSAITSPQNNPYGAYQLASAGVSQQVASAQSTQKTELNYGQGFLSSRGNCPTTTTGKSTTGAGGATSLSANSTCQSMPIQTPGSIISGQLNKALGTGNDTLVSAHEVDELVSALLGQLTKAVIGPGGGLSGLSQSSPSTGNTTYFAQTDPTQSAINTTLSSNFTTTIAGQLAGVQAFQADWNTINGAAQSALSALSSPGTCYPNPQNAITTVVQPVISQAATSLSQAASSITALQKVQAELPDPNSTADQTVALNQASSDYTAASAVVPSPAQLQSAQTNSVPDATTTPPSLLTQMNDIIASSSCETIPQIVIPSGVTSGIQQ